MFLVCSNFDFQFLTMTSRGGQYFYRFSSACRLIEYNSSITPEMTIGISIQTCRFNFFGIWSYFYLTFMASLSKKNDELFLCYYFQQKLFFLFVKQFVMYNENFLQFYYFLLQSYYELTSQSLKNNFNQNRALNRLKNLSKSTRRVKVNVKLFQIKNF